MTILRSLLASGAGRTVADGLTATGSSAGTAFAMATDVAIFTTVAAGAGVILFARASLNVINMGANALTVYAPAGGSINGAQSVTIPAGTAANFAASNGSTFTAF